MLMVSYVDLPHPAIFAHRGASAHAPENTLVAFELAITQGCDGIEFDVMLSADRQVVVIHDSTLMRTTGHKGKVADLSLSEIKRLDAGSYFDIQFSDVRIPTLEEVFETVGKRTYMNIELKNYESLGDDLPDRVASLVRRQNMTDNVLFSSFNPIALRKINRLLPESPTGLLALPGISGWWARSFIGRLLVSYLAIHPEYHDVSKEFIARYHEMGKRIYPYTVNTPEHMRALFSYGVDGVFTDDPKLARSIKASVHQSTSVVE